MRLVRDTLCALLRFSMIEQRIFYFYTLLEVGNRTNSVWKIVRCFFRHANLSTQASVFIVKRLQNTVQKNKQKNSDVTAQKGDQHAIIPGRAGQRYTKKYSGIQILRRMCFKSQNSDTEIHLLFTQRDIPETFLQKRQKSIP